MVKKSLVALLGSVSLASCGVFCVARGTLVSTPRGRRLIEELVEQDTVWSIDPATGERAASRVTALTRATREVMRLSGEGFLLTCTTDHPLYDPTTRSFAPAGDWVLGTRSELLLVPDDGGRPRVVTVHTREVSAGLAEVIDVTVEHELHNFVAGGVLVHNKSLPRRAPPTCTVVSAGTAQQLSHLAACTRPDGGAGVVNCTSTFADGSCDE